MQPDPVPQEQGVDPVAVVRRELNANTMGFSAPTQRVAEYIVAALRDANLLRSETPEAGVRRIRADGLPHGIRDACSECSEVAWESCFLRGQCKHYMLPGDLAPTPDGDVGEA